VAQRLAASQRQGPGFDSQLGSLSVFSPCLCGFPPGALVTSDSLKDVLVRCIGYAKFSLSVTEQAPECGDYGIFSDFIAVLM